MVAATPEPDDRFTLVQQLANDLSKGNLELPSFPDIALRVRKALDDEMATTDHIVQILGAEPVLAAKILAIANSAAMRPSTDAITDLPMAVNRIGRTMVRNAAMSFAVAQTKKGYKSQGVRRAARQALVGVRARRRAVLHPHEEIHVP